MEIKIFDKNGNIVDTNQLIITNGHNDKPIINIYGDAEYYIDSLKEWWKNRNNAVMCIDMGKGWYVFVQPLKDFIATSETH